MHDKIVKNNDGVSSSQAPERGFSLANDPNASAFEKPSRWGEVLNDLIYRDESSV